MISTKLEILQSLNKYGFCKIHISDLSELEPLYKDNHDFMNRVVRHDEIVRRAELLKKGTPVRDRTKYFEFQNAQLLGEGLSLNNSPVLDFYLHDTFLDIAESYLQTNEVRVRNCLAFYHPQNPFPPANSQNWHRDTEDTKILKVFVYYNDVEEKNGSLWYTKNSKHGSKNDSIWPNVGKAKHGYLDLESVMKIPYNDIVKLEGKAGTICFFDANGFHKGGSVVEGERISTHCCYIRSDAPHIVNNVLPNFEYNESVNTIDRSSAKYLSLSDRQKKVLQ
jgi:hypothetical protein